MIIESAFGYLPEVLTGSNYAVQKYEAGIVTAVSLAVLQELNARNVPNPLSTLSVEKLYSNDGFTRPVGFPKEGTPRYLRADLFLDTSRTFAATQALARFGWRHRNWLEAKFFRKGKSSSTTNAALLFGDLLRLCALVPPEVVKKRGADQLPSPCDILSENGNYTDLCVGRYLLHVYDDDPGELVGKTGRPWIKKMRTAGKVEFKTKISDDKAEKGFRKALSEHLDSLEIEVAMTNMIVSQTTSATQGRYFCALSRIDSFSISFDAARWDEKTDRTGMEATVGDWKKIRDAVGQYLLLTSKESEGATEDAPPTDAELVVETQGAINDVQG